MVATEFSLVSFVPEVCTFHDIELEIALRCQPMHPRYQYDVPGPNTLWHIHGLDKLIWWGFVVHGRTASFSRLVVFLKCARNNRAETVMSSFFEGTEKYEIRSDYCGEYIKIYGVDEGNKLWFSYSKIICT